MATKWTEEKEKIILEEVEKNPEHIRDAFKVASERIGKTPYAVCTRYYGKMNSNAKENMHKL